MTELKAQSYPVLPLRDIVVFPHMIVPLFVGREKSVRALEEGLSGVMVALAFPNVNYVTLEEVAGRMKAVPMDSDTLQTGRDLGVCFGD